MTRNKLIGLISTASICAAALIGWIDLANASADTPILSVDVTILPDSRYLLTAPGEAEVLKAPVAGSVHLPESDLPDKYDSRAMVYEANVADTNAVAIVKYTSLLDKVELKLKRANSYAQYLQDYGLQGIDSPISNQPWDWETDSSKRAAQRDAVDVLNTFNSSSAAPPSSESDDDAKLKELRTALNAPSANAPLPDEIASLARTIASRSKEPYNLTPAQWREVLEKAIVYDLRQSQGLDSQLIDFAPGEISDVPPNYFISSPSEFEVGRTLEKGTLEEEDFRQRDWERFLSYWQTVVNENLYNDADIEFLKKIALGHDWKSTAAELVDECKAAAASLDKWRDLTSQYPITSANPTLWLRARYPSESDATIADLGSATSSAKQTGEATVSRPLSSATAINWVADQTRSGWSYNGSLVRVYEAPGAFSKVPSAKGVSIHYLLLKPGTRGFILLPNQPGDAVWQHLQENLTGEISNSEDFSDKDPFGPLVWQTVLTLSPTVERASQPDASADALYSAGQLVDLFGADLRGKIRQAAPTVRGYGRELLSEYNGDRNALRYGHFVVPEPSIVDDVYVAAHELLKAGAPIAVVRPTYSYKLQSHFRLSSEIQQFVVPGTTLHLKLSCKGPIDTTADEKRAIMTKADKTGILRWLVQVKHNYLAGVVFDAHIDALDAEPNTVDPASPDRTVNALFSFEIPESKRSVMTDALPAVGSLASSKEELIASIKFPLSSNSFGAQPTQSLVLDAGPLVIGEVCRATFALPDEQEGGALQLLRNWDLIRPPN